MPSEQRRRRKDSPGRSSNKNRRESAESDLGDSFLGDVADLSLTQKGSETKLSEEEILLNFEDKLREEVDPDFFEDPKTFKTLNRVIDILGASLADQGKKEKARNRFATKSHQDDAHSELDSLHRSNPAYLAMRRQQRVVDDAIEHMVVNHCSELNNSVEAVGRVSRQFNEAVNKVKSLQQQVRDIKESLSNSSYRREPGETQANGGGPPPQTKSLRELWLKKLECEAVLSLLGKLETIRNAPSLFDNLIQPPAATAGAGAPCRIGAATVLLMNALSTMFEDDVAQIQALHKITEQLTTRKLRAEEIVWDTLIDLVFLRTGNGAPGAKPKKKTKATGASETNASGNNASTDVADEDDLDETDAMDSDDDGSIKSSATNSIYHYESSMTNLSIKHLIPKSVIECELDLEVDELRCLEDAADFAAAGRKRGGPSANMDGEVFHPPKYTDPILALRILVECLAKLGRLDDVERYLNESMEREVRKLSELQQAETLKRLAARKQLHMKKSRGRGLVADSNPAEFTMSDFRQHLSGLLQSYNSVLLRLNTLAQVLRYRIFIDPRILTPSYQDQSSALHAVLVNASTLMQREIKGFIRTCLQGTEDDGDSVQRQDRGARGSLPSADGVGGGLFSLGVINQETLRASASSMGAGTAVSSCNITVSRNAMELPVDQFVSTILFAHTTLVPEVRHALEFRRTLAKFVYQTTAMTKELAFLSAQDTSSPSYNATTEEGVLEFLDRAIQYELLPILQAEAERGTTSALEKADAFEPNLDTNIYASLSQPGYEAEMCLACKAMYHSTGLLFTALHRLPRGGEMFSSVVAVLEQVILTFNSRVTQRIRAICEDKTSYQLLEVEEGRRGKTSFSTSVEYRHAYTLLLDSYHDADGDGVRDDPTDAAATGGAGILPIAPHPGDTKSQASGDDNHNQAAIDADMNEGFDQNREYEALEKELVSVDPLLRFANDNYGADMDYCNEEELMRAACLAHSLLNLAFMMEGRLKKSRNRSGPSSLATAGATLALRESIKTIKMHGLRMAKFCRIDILVQTAVKMSKIMRSSCLLAKDAVRLPSCVQDLGEFLTSMSEYLREVGGNAIAAYALSSLEQYIPLFLMQTVRYIASGEAFPRNAIISLNGIESLDRSGSVLYRDLKGATSFRGSFWDEEAAAEAFERSAGFVAMMELDMDELESYCRNNRDAFDNEDYELMFAMNGPRRIGDVQRFQALG
mmetsp:Transcript_24564/g.44444  ORF Transcript_24564/g.44444 Transcript_24564/m.44444 type:complete len:1215 (-) Transcript_24564:748-4392(-)